MIVTMKSISSFGIGVGSDLKRAAYREVARGILWAPSGSNDAF